MASADAGRFSDRNVVVVRAVLGTGRRPLSSRIHVGLRTPVRGKKLNLPLNQNEKPHSKFRHLYAVLRIDLPVSRENPENSISVIKVFHSMMSAEQEVDRLNKVNSERGC